MIGSLGATTATPSENQQEGSTNMAVNLSKGGNINLSKEDPGLKHVIAGLGWDPRSTDGQQFDLDASVILCGADKKALSDAHFVFYNNLSSPDGSVVHQGDNRDGQGDGDDEMVGVNLPAVPAEVEYIAFIVSIDQAEQRGQSFGQVANAYIRIVNHETGAEVARYDLGEDASTERSLVFAELYRNGGDWKFRAVGQGYNSGLAGVIADFGLAAG